MVIASASVDWDPDKWDADVWDSSSEEEKHDDWEDPPDPTIDPPSYLGAYPVTRRKNKIIGEEGNQREKLQMVEQDFSQAEVRQTC